jgi:hypothetical protein
MLLNWLDFNMFILLVSLVLIFSLNHYLLNLFLVNEIIWITLGLYYLIYSFEVDIFILIIVSIGVFSVATGETVTGLSLLILKSSLGSTISSPNFSIVKNNFLTRYKKINFKIKNVKN